MDGLDLYVKVVQKYNRQEWYLPKVLSKAFFTSYSYDINVTAKFFNSSIIPISCLKLNNLKSYQNYTSRTENLETVFDFKFDCLSGFRVNQKRVSGNCFKETAEQMVFLSLIC